MENKLPILVFDTNKPGNLVAAVKGEAVGTPVGPAAFTVIALAAMA